MVAARGASRRKDFGFRRGPVVSRNLHYTLGLYASLVLAMLSFTGIFLAFPEAGRAAVGALAPVSPSPRGMQAPESQGRPITPDDAVAIARAQLPERGGHGVGMPGGAARCRTASRCASPATTASAAAP